MNDNCLDFIYAKWDKIIMMYYAFKEKKPIIEYELHTQKLYSYSAKEYINSLSTRTREDTRKQYEE